MRKRLLLWLAFVMLFLLMDFVLLILPALEDRGRAREGYARARAELEEVTRRQESLRSEVQALSTRIDSIELDARREYRLIRPGERVEIIRSDAVAVGRNEQAFSGRVQ